MRITAGWTDDGKQKFKYISYHAKKTDAVIALAEFNKNPYDIDAAKITFAEIYEKWSSVGYRTLSDSAVNNYRSTYKHCSPIYDKVFRDLKKTHLQAVIDKIEAPSMAETTKFLFGKLYTFAIENDIVEKDYSKFVKLPKKPPAKKKIPFTNEEIAYLWENINFIKYADFTLILLYTGMRIGELLDITKDDVFLDERYMIGGKKTDAGIDRIIPLHKDIIPLIEKRMAESPSQWLFLNKRGAPLQYSPFMKYHWPNLMAKFKVDHTPHDTRHTFVSEMNRRGVNVITVKRIVGHSNADITEHYTHKHISELIEAVDRLEYKL